MTQELAKTKNGQLPATELADELLQDANLGFQGVGANDMAIPFLAIIQSNSPQRKKSDGAYIPGADEGMVFNTASGELYDATSEPLIVIPCAFERRMLHWRRREDGGGFLGAHAPDDPICRQATREGAREVLPDGTYLANTAQHYVLLLRPDGTFKRAVISMSSTQLKKSRRWLTIMGEKTMKSSAGKVFTPPTFAYKYKLTTQAEENDRGSWYGWRVEDAGVLDYANAEREVYQAAKKFSEAVLKGTVKTADPHPEGGEDLPF